MPSVVAVGQEVGVGVVNIYATGVGRSLEAHLKHRQYIGTADECHRTHWPYYVIVDQINALTLMARNW